MKTIDVKLVYSDSAPAYKDVIWAKKTAGGIIFQMYGNSGWTTVGAENIEKFINTEAKNAISECKDIPEGIPSLDENGRIPEDLMPYGEITYLLGTIADDFDGSQSLTSDIEVAVGQSIRVYNDTIDITATLVYGSGTTEYSFAYLIDDNEQSVGSVNFQNNKLTGVSGDAVLAGANIEFTEILTIEDKYIPDSVKKYGCSNKVISCHSSDSYTFEFDTYYDISGGVNDILFNIPDNNRAELYRGCMHNATATFPDGTLITGDLEYLTILGTTVTASSSEWYSWTYDSYTKELNFRLYREL